MRSRRKGFTLIELLVVIAIIAILIALLVPAVQKVRESAARIQCTNNVKQLSIAAHNHAGTHKKLPTLWFHKAGSPSTYTNLFYQILPFIEQDPVYAQAVQTNGNRWAFFCRSNIINTYLCPSDTTEGTNIDTMNNNTRMWASGNYAGNIMVFDPFPEPVNPAAALDPNTTNNNALGRGFNLVTGMPDGTSNTVVFAHRLKRCDANGPGGISGQTATDWASYPRDSQWGWAAVPGFGYRSYNKLWGNKVWTASWAIDFSTSASPSSGLPFQTGPIFGVCNYTITVSPHADMMVAGLGDGSVRTVSSGIATSTWYNACHPQDGNILGPDWN